MSAEMKDLMTFNFRKMKFESCTHDREKADDAKAFYWKTLSEEPQVQEIVKAFNDLRSAKDNPPKLIDGRTKEEVDVDVLKENNILLIISGFSNGDFMKLKSIYEEATSKNSKDNYEIVWIPIGEKQIHKKQIVEKFGAWSMLTTEKPWYVLPCPSSREKWKFKNEFIMKVIKGKDEVTNAFSLIIAPTTEGLKKRNYVFYFRGTNDEWNKIFFAKAKKVGEDVLLSQLGIFVKSFGVSTESQIKEANTRLKSPIFSKDTSVPFVVLTEEDKVLLEGPGDKIRGVLERFDEWKMEVERKGFGSSFYDQMP